MRLRPEYGFSDSDLDFIVREAEPSASEQTREELKRLVCEDGAFREGMVGCDRVFRKVMGDDEVFLKISARLFFEILIRRAARELASAGHTLEREGRHRIFVLDSDDVIELLNQYPVVYYLADVLASFSADGELRNAHAHAHAPRSMASCPLQRNGCPQYDSSMQCH